MMDHLTTEVSDSQSESETFEDVQRASEKVDKHPDCIHYTAERVEDGTYQCTACDATLLVVVE